MPRLLTPALLASLLLTTPALAQTNESYNTPEFSTPEQAARYYHLLRIVQCPNCQGSPVASSPSPFAITISTEIAQRINRGQSDDEIRAFLIERYGPSIVSDPPLSATTLPLYLVAILSLLGMISLGVVYAKRLQ